jgi:hypothetical protein
MTPRRNNPPEECIKKEHITGFQRSLKLLGLQPQDFGINNEVSTSKSRKSSSRYYEYINLYDLEWKWKYILKWVLMKDFIAGLDQHFLLVLQIEVSLLKI